MSQFDADNKVLAKVRGKPRERNYQVMRPYELMYLIPPTADEERLAAVCEQDLFEAPDDPGEHHHAPPRLRPAGGRKVLRRDPRRTFIARTDTRC